MLGRWRLPASHVSSLFYKSYCASSIPPFDKIILKQITYIKATKIYRLGSYEDCFESKLTVVEPLHYECIVRLSTSFNKVKKDLEKENLNIPLAQIRTNIDIKGENTLSFYYEFYSSTAEVISSLEIFKAQQSCYS